MGAYAQANRQLRLQTDLGEDVLLVAGFTGVERISEPYLFNIEMYSERDDIEPNEVLRTPMVLSMLLPNGDTRLIHGLVRRFVQLDRAAQLTAYTAEIVPWLWFLSLSRDCRVFQHMSVLEVVESVFKELGWSAFRFNTLRSYPQREYCVQYRESHLDFVSRLLEEEGLFYFFRHSDAGHELVIADRVDTAEACPGGGEVRLAPEAVPDEDVVLALRRDHTVHAGSLTLMDYDYLQPKMSLSCSLEGSGSEEIYDYPGGYSSRQDGERYARIALEREEALRSVVRGEGTCRAFQVGCTFELDHHYQREANRGYLLQEVAHEARADSYRSGDQEAFDYRNRFVASPDDTPYRPPTRTPKPRIHGSQTAVVVGKAGEEVWTDGHGRIKVQFHWDRRGAADENSSCWVRVATPWGGKGYGALSVPRIGNEVVVEFLEGDPDRPLVIGSVYNDEDVPPFDLPGAGITMGMKTRSSPGGGGANEISMTDTKGQEEVKIHAQYDMATTVEHDQSVGVDNNQGITVGGNQSRTVGGNRVAAVGGSESNNVGGARSTVVALGEVRTIGGSHKTMIGRHESISVTSRRSVQVGDDVKIEVGGERSLTVGKDEKISVGGNRSALAGEHMMLDAGKELTLTAGDEITIQTGKASIILKKDGTITLKGKDIVVNGSGKINVKAKSTITLKGSKIKQN
jgi:type VI secretion system secreted protein VgrG